MAQLTIRRIGYALGAEVTGIDLKRPLDAETLDRVRAAWLEHLMLCFPRQDLSRDELLAFGRQFGELEVGVKRIADPDRPNLTLLSEQPIDGRPWSGYKGGMIWHTDQSYTTQPTAATILNSKVLPPVGGDTMFANTYLAYDALSPAMQRLVDGLSAIHNGAVLGETRSGSAAQSGNVLSEQAAAASKAERSAAFPPTVHPVARIHPETGRKALYLGERGLRRFAGMTEEESGPLLDFLNAHAVRYEFTYRHRWTPADLVMWDNRCTMHIALCDYDLRNDTRLMFRCATAGTPSGHTYAPADDIAPATAGARS